MRGNGVTGEKTSVVDLKTKKLTRVELWNWCQAMLDKANLHCITFSWSFLVLSYTLMERGFLSFYCSQVFHQESSRGT